VSVVDNQGNVLSENQDNDSVAGLSSDQLSARRNVEQYLSRKAQGMLETVLGPGQAVVRVSADLNWDTISRTEEKYDPDGQVARTTTVNDENTDSSTANTGGVAGMSGGTVDANGVTNTPVAEPLNVTRTKKKITSNNYEINKTTSNILQAAGGVKRVTAAVFVAQQFSGKGVDRKAVPRTPDEMQKLRRIVQSALGIQDNSADPTGITLEEMPFNDQFASDVTQQLDQQEKRQYWTDQGWKLFYPALALGIVFMFWRAFKRVKVDDIPVGVPLGNGHGKGGQPGGMVTVEVLNQLIRENPANMSSAVRSWMNRGNKPNN
jgi:flagellar M-ring protein FliF